MSCTSLSVTAVNPSALHVAAEGKPSRLTVSPSGSSRLAVLAKPGASLSIEASAQHAALALSTGPKSRLTVSQVCSVSGGELYVLAATDGILRTKTGGYILLAPDKS